MGELVHLTKRNLAPRHDVAASEPLTAQILFFTGVRYHKYNDEAETAALAGPKDGAGPGHNKSGRKRRA